ncbi:hypothetical protein [Sphingomonas faeni]|uniref:hypothetical protein n=1 Tax=Sphingomonas faeni TaxID=185950 RepID=UPI0020BE323E|nr:hypothetical protein [Sphingomonas faeni]MCK8458389.1 hypothetical protein [Sphingomonas faeni]
MSIRCIFGHHASISRRNAGLCVGVCDRCGVTLIGEAGGRWWKLSRHYRIVWAERGRHAISPYEALRIARRAASPLHHLRRVRDSFAGYHLN